MSKRSRHIPLLILVSAASGAGKTTLLHRVLAARPDMKRAITCTTRPPRRGEEDGIDYYFVSEKRFMQLLMSGKFVEHAKVYGYNYGLLRAELLKKLRAGTDVLVNVDVQGAATIRGKAAADPELQRSLVTLFLTPSSLTELEKRLRSRGTDSEKVIQRRLRAARREMKHWHRFDYLLVSDTMEADLSRALMIIDVERMRTERAVAPKV
jgi:guanylate kinase